MNWILIAWPAMGAMCLTLALIHSVIWARYGGRPSHLAFVIMVVAVIAISVQELLLMFARDPALYATYLRNAHVAGALMFIAMATFVRLEFPASRPWLFWATCATRVAALAANFLTGVNLNYQRIDALEQVSVWGGLVVARPIGEVNPWMLLGQLNILLLLAFLVDTILRTRRVAGARNRSRAWRICGAFALFLLAANAWRVGVILGDIRAPDILIPAFLCVVLITSYELAGDVFRSNRLAEDLIQTQSRLLESQGRMEDAVKAARLGLWSWNFQRQRFWTSGLDSALLSSEAAVEQDELFGDIHPEDQPLLQAALQRAQAGGNFNCVFRLRPVPGLATHWMAARGRVDRDGAGNPLRLHGVLADISERQRGEELFHLAVEASPTAMLVVDGGGRIALANKQAEVVFGYPRLELLGLSIEELVPAPMREMHSCQRVQYAKAPEVRMMGIGRELFGLRKDGVLVPVEVALNPLRVGDDDVTLASVIDLRERKRLEGESASHRDELAHLSRVALLSELSGSLAHELNQPLTAILSNAQAAIRFMSQSPPDMEEVREILVNIVDSDKRAGEVIRRLGAMLRKEPANHQLLDMNDVVEDVLRIVRSDLLSRNCRTVLDLAADLPPVLGDRIQLQQVLLNLLVNGCDAMASRPVDAREITIRTRPQPDRGVRLTVSDLGHGIPDKDLERIFSPFVTTKANGLGLGLAVCSTIVRSHQGRLRASNNETQGASLHIELPPAEEMRTT